MFIFNICFTDKSHLWLLQYVNHKQATEKIKRMVCAQELPGSNLGEDIEFSDTLVYQENST